MRNLSLLWTDGCNGENCPALYATDGGYVVQGKTLDADTTLQMENRGPDETGVFVPAHILDRLVDERLRQMGIA